MGAHKINRAFSFFLPNQENENRQKGTGCHRNRQKDG